MEPRKSVGYIYICMYIFALKTFWQLLILVMHVAGKKKKKKKPFGLVSFNFNSPNHTSLSIPIPNCPRIPF